MPLSASLAGNRAQLLAKNAVIMLLDVIDKADRDGSGSFLACDGPEIAR